VEKDHKNELLLIFAVCKFWANIVLHHLIRSTLRFGCKTHLWNFCPAHVSLATDGYTNSTHPADRDGQEE
jgi:uncharacterized membrane protein